ncbi:DUF808 domain-containing protein [Shewanella pneumatophori]|uniref:DUF808 domain-containing protein n=1 Tax=Shewanella pneumatophori TaxID=314092 RepID=A0A9X1ZEY3_9GAMM|nr:DUF808 domain-containing protein [Shewanella pneumatophori]MCL1138675.1 DUF808 domain-containing protein [Shewanella pneumatophori]
MAGASLLTLLDDIATILDDVAAMSKIAARKTAGVLGDDLALNAQQVTGVSADRELPVVWAVALGSFKNKCILVPAAMLISAFIPWAVTPLLMFGGLFLCYEGFEKIYHSYSAKKHPQVDTDASEEPITDVKEYEKNKVKGAIRTDFVLSAEIIAITLGIVADKSLSTQFFTLSVIAIVMTIGVYGLVAGIVKLDDAGLYLSQRPGESAWASFKRRFGFMLLSSAPYLMKTLSVVGTIAMFMVGGGILTHGWHWIGDKISAAATWVAAFDFVGPLVAFITPSILNALFGVVAGAIAVLLMQLVTKLKGDKSAQS